ncbi:MAG: undecaprenyl-diphosphatase UppP [Chloroflexota bacterium]
MDLFHALVLGIVQGLTEFLPISSSAHLLIVPWLLGWNEPSLTSIQFDVSLHIGTLVAVLIYFAGDWRRIITGFVGSVIERKIGDNPDRKLAWLVILGSIPAAVVGVLGESKIDEIFHDPANLRTAMLVIATTMIALALLLFVAERVGKHSLDLRHIGLSAAITIGVAQALALIPGVSRSGSTITAGLFMNLKRESAARFSFLLATPVILGAGVKKLYDVVQAGGIPADQQLGFIIGFLAAAISGFLCIAFLLRYLQRNSTLPFIIYRIALGILLFVLVAVSYNM